MLVFATFSVLISLLPAVLGHANITSPAIREPGPAHLAKCGQKSYNELKRDRTGHIEDQMPVTAGCEILLCRGMVSLCRQSRRCSLTRISSYSRTSQLPASSL
jgi:hypothetical protein